MNASADHHWRPLMGHLISEFVIVATFLVSLGLNSRLLEWASLHGASYYVGLFTLIFTEIVGALVVSAHVSARIRDNLLKRYRKYIKKRKKNRDP